MNKRIFELRKYFNLSQEKFGEKLGVTKSAVSKMELGTYNITDTILRLIAKEFNVSYEWLVNGTGEMILSKNRINEISKLTNQLLSEEENSFKNRLISALANLSEQQWQVLADIAENLADKEKKDIQIQQKKQPNIYKIVDNNMEIAEELIPEEHTIEELEEEYKKTLHSAPKTTSTVLPTTKETIENTKENKVI